MSKEIDDPIDRICAARGITRAQYELEGILQQEQIDALWKLAQDEDEDPIVPDFLPGAGKRRSDLTDRELEALHLNQMALDKLMPGAFVPLGPVDDGLPVDDHDDETKN